jgi:hypothetical protein
MEDFFDNWDCHVCGYATVLSNNPTTRGMVMPCDDQRRQNIATACARLPRWDEWGDQTALLQALTHGDSDMFTGSVDHSSALALVVDIAPVLQTLGLYEAALLDGLIAARGNYHTWETRVLHLLLDQADRARLRAVGDPFPRQDAYRLYRGVAGAGKHRRVRGLSWTGSLERAWWFARRYASLPRPAVYRVDVPARYVLAYSNERQEEEYLVRLPSRFPVTRIKPERNGTACQIWDLAVEPRRALGW